MAMLSREAEEYLETILRRKELGESTKAKDLAEELKISAASVSEMLRKLVQMRLIRYTPSKTIELTKRGEEKAAAILRKHRLVQKFLIQFGVKKWKAHKEACVLEHAVSDEVERTLRAALTSAKKHEITAERIKRLIDLKQGEKGRILFIVGGRGACQRLADMGLTPGTMVRIGRTSRYIGPLEVYVRSSSLAIGRGLANKIFVEVE